VHAVGGSSLSRLRREAGGRYRTMLRCSPRPSLAGTRPRFEVRHEPPLSLGTGQDHRLRKARLFSPQVEGPTRAPEELRGLVGAQKKRRR